MDQFYSSPYFIGFVVLIIIVLLYYNGYFDAKKPKAEKVKSKEDESFVASGGRSDSNGEDMGLIDRIHAINKAQQDYVNNPNNAKNTYKYDARENAVPAIYSPEEQLQTDLYQQSD